MWLHMLFMSQHMEGLLSLIGQSEACQNGSEKSLQSRSEKYYLVQ